MDIQDYMGYAVVTGAALFVVRSLIRQFSTREKEGCPGCSHCGSQETSSQSLVSLENDINPDVQTGRTAGNRET
ncbi:MAG: FeoB-associated Cys-rich membrane protein [Candidatus Latescibacteria bacterium]|nr:FeoB-associated Cys-rich membrane protein [Candidatus Latescibacterota bacterium]